MNKWLILLIGGGLGTVLRFAVSVWANRQIEHSFPYGTLIVNLSGCLLIGMLAGWESANELHENTKLLLFVGLMGGFTTFSSFSLETLQLLRSGAIGSAVIYVLVSTLGGLLLAAGGFKLTS
ncbi:MAG: fluoride efflux transporter CrcB [Bacteroidota bacterium]